MKNWFGNIFGFCFLLCFNAFGAESDLGFPKVEVTGEDRVLVLAPHPDDEAIACGGIIQEAVAKGIPVKIVFFTYGDNNQWSFILYRKHLVIKPRAVRTMGLIRHDEAEKADSILGVPSGNLIFLGYPDFKTLNIWNAAWGNEPSVRSMLTKVDHVPYNNAYCPGALYKGEEVLKELKSIILDFKPTKIFLSHPGDHNVDHRALYLFSKVALWDLEKELKPEIYPYLVHFKNWPKPRGYFPLEILRPPLLFKDQVLWKTYYLSNDAIKIKEDAVKAHATQFKSSGAYLSSFVRQNELFGDFPEINLVKDALSLSLLPDRKEDFLEYPEELIGREVAVFVGIEEKHVQLKDKNIEFSIKFSKEVAKKVGVSLYVFGYKTEVPFSEMPKLHIKIGERGHRIYEKNKIIETQDIKIERDRYNIKIKIPLEILGNPQRILTSAHSYLDEVPLDLVSWRILALPEEKAEK